MAASNPYILFDGHNTAYRSAAVINLTNEDGKSVAVPFGVIRSIRFIAERFKPKDMAVIWDGGRAEYRVALQSDYKRTERRRKSKKKFEEDDIQGSVKITQELLRYLGVSQLKFRYVEADDLICKLADDLTNVLIISTDRDFYQLIDRNISVYDPIKDIVIDCKNFAEQVKLPFTPEQYLEYHILLGDSSDNIPGVLGVGKKTAYDLITRFKSVHDAIRAVGRNPESFPKRTRNLITSTSKSQLVTNRALIDLRGFVAELRQLGENQLESNPEADYRKFESTISGKRLSFRSILKEFNYWVMPFRKLSIRRKHNEKSPFSF